MQLILRYARCFERLAQTGHYRRVVEIGPGSSSAIIIALKAVRPANAYHYNGIEASAQMASPLKQYLDLFQVKGSVITGDFFDQLVYIRDGSILCFEHSLEDLYFHYVRKALNVDELPSMDWIEKLSRESANFHDPLLYNFLLDFFAHVNDLLSRKYVSVILRHYCWPERSYSPLYGMIDWLIIQIVPRLIKNFNLPVMPEFGHTSLDREFFFVLGVRE
ncbi:MAG: hypothetical protein RLY93_16050 [Sumerlaeia bacterium]